MKLSKTVARERRSPDDRGRSTRKQSEVERKEGEQKDSWMRCGVPAPVSESRFGGAPSVPRLRVHPIHATLTGPRTLGVLATERYFPRTVSIDHLFETVTHEEGRSCSVSRPPPVVVDALYPRDAEPVLETSVGRRLRDSGRKEATFFVT